MISVCTGCRSSVKGNRELYEMALGVLFHEHYALRYLPRTLSSQLFYILCLLVVLIMPAFVGYVMDNFWIQDNYYYAAANVKFTERCVLHYTTVKGQEKLWTCSEAFNEHFLPQGDSLAVLPFFSIYSSYNYENGNMNSITFVLGLPVNEFGSGGEGVPLPSSGNADAIDRVDFLPEFTYVIDSGPAAVSMTAAPLITFQRTSSTGTVGGPLAAHSQGDMVYRSTRQIYAGWEVGNTLAYAGSPFDKVRDVADILNVPNFAAQYTSRNQSVYFDRYAETVGGLRLLQNENYNRVLGEDLDALGDFTWKITLRVPPAQVQYIPSYREQFKWAWVQYFCIAYVFQWVLWQVRGCVVKMGLVCTTAVFHRGLKQN